MHSPLENLHQSFTEAINQQTYIGLSQGPSPQLESTQQKTIRMAEVFKRAHEEIADNFNDHHQPDAKEISQLKALKQDGNLIYLRYQKSTHHWIRTLMKGLARYTPDFLKKFLPDCFSNKMEQAENETFKQYGIYKAVLTQFVPADDTTSEADDNDASADLSSGKENGEDDEEIYDPEHYDSEQDTFLLEQKKKPSPTHILSEGNLFGEDFPFNYEDFETQRALYEQIISQNQSHQSHPEKKIGTPSENKKEAESPLPAIQLAPTFSTLDHSPTPSTPIPIPVVDDQAILEQTVNACALSLHKCSELLNHFGERPVSFILFKNALRHIVNTTSILTEIGQKGQSALENIGFNEETLATLTNEKLRSALLSALALQDDGEISKILASTPWKSFFEEALNQKGYIRFGVQKLGGQSLLQLMNEDNKKVQENVLKSYRGKINIAISDSSALNEIEQLVKFLKNNESCRPHSILININESESLTPELVSHLLTLKDRVAHIEIKGLQTIDFKALGLTEQEEYELVENFSSFSFPNLQDITLSDQAKTNWTANHFSMLLAHSPTIEFFISCYQQCSCFQEIIIPQVLREIKELDCLEFNLDQISVLLPNFSELTSINLSGLPLKDDLLIHWIQQGLLNHIQDLKLDGCQELTTDALMSIAKLPRLTTLTLPDLTLGSISLDQLPKFDNPFKINLLYTASQVTQSRISSLYTGPMAWSSLFQIPLARLGVENIFSPHQRLLSPKNVAYWLYNQDYKHLAPQTSIVTVLAEFNATLDDENIVEFMEKFPNVKTLSLYESPNVTDKGIINLLQKYPQIQVLDLTGCSHITDGLLLGDGNLALLKKLKKMIVTQSGMTDKVVKTFQKQGVKLLFANATLKITDADLTDDQSFETLLEGMDLTELKKIDLEGCANLTNAMLGSLLDHLNAPAFIQMQDGTLVDNPQRLNAAVINIKNCENITEEAFQNTQTNQDDADQDQESVKKIDLKLLESLERVVIGGTPLSKSKVLKDLYPEVTFQETDEPLTIQINPELQLAECIHYHKTSKQSHLWGDEKIHLKKSGERYLHNRTVAELFIQEQALPKDLLQESVDIHSEDFSDIILSFSKTESSTESTIFHAHRDVLCSLSPYFLKGHRPGGTMRKMAGVNLINDHATPEAVQAVMDLFYGKSTIHNLDWETAAHAAELVGCDNFNFPKSYYKKLLDRIHAQFEFERADQMLLVAQQLKDEVGQKEYENTLLQILASLELNELDGNDKNYLISIGNLAKSHHLKELQAEVEKIETAITELLIKAQHDQEEYLTIQALNQSP